MTTATIKDWQTFPPGKEKYQLYLASREWAVHKESIRARSGGICERCRYGTASQVHHQTYERIYRERPDDLVHLCRECHEFLSGKRERDPMLDVPPPPGLHLAILVGLIKVPDSLDFPVGGIVACFDLPGIVRDGSSATFLLVDEWFFHDTNRVRQAAEAMRGQPVENGEFDMLSCMGKGCLVLFRERGSEPSFKSIPDGLKHEPSAKTRFLHHEGTLTPPAWLPHYKGRPIADLL